MKICLITQQLGAGGLERVLTELASYFSLKRGSEVHVISLSDNKCFYRLPEDVAVHYLSSGKHNGITQKIFMLIFLRNKVTQIKPDTVLSFGVIFNILTLFALLFTKYSVYVSDRNTPLFHLNQFRFFLKKQLYKRAKGIICQTEYSKQIAECYIQNQNLTIIPNPIKDFGVCNLTIEKQNIILNIGRLIKSKRQDKLMDIFASIDNKDWHLLFVGSGEMRDYYIAYAEKLHISGQVTFVEANDNLSNYLAQSKIFAFTSETEGFPNVLGEAMFFPVACISFDCVAGPRDLITDYKDGFLIPMGDDKLYAERLSMLMHDANLREELQLQAMKKRGIYSIDNIGEKFYETITRHL